MIRVLGAEANCRMKRTFLVTPVEVSQGLLPGGRLWLPVPLLGGPEKTHVPALSLLFGGGVSLVNI